MTTRASACPIKAVCLFVAAVNLSVPHANAQVADNYHYSFSKADPLEARPEFESAVVPDTLDAPQPELKAEEIQASFPLTLGENGKGNAPKAPESLSRKMRAGTCTFYLEATRFLVNRYELTGVGEYSLKEAAVKPGSIVDAEPTGDFLLSVSAQVSVRVDDADVAGCKRQFARGRRVALPPVELDGEIKSIRSSKAVKSQRTTQEAAGDQIVLSFDSSLNELKAKNDQGIAPTIETALFKFEPVAAGGFLAYSPSWRVVRN